MPADKIKEFAPSGKYALVKVGSKSAWVHTSDLMPAKKAAVKKAMPAGANYKTVRRAAENNFKIKKYLK